MAPPAICSSKSTSAADDRFGRSGDHLTVHVPVTFAEAALGGDIEVPTLDEGTVTLRLKPGTQSGSRHRVKGKGISTTSQAVRGRRRVT